MESYRINPRIFYSPDKGNTGKGRDNKKSSYNPSHLNGLRQEDGSFAPFEPMSLDGIWPEGRGLLEERKRLTHLSGQIPDKFGRCTPAF